MGLTNNQQAILVFIAFALPSLGTWASLGFPTDRLALGALVAALIAGIILAIKEAWGVAVPTSPTSTPPPAAAATKAVTPLAIFKMKRRLMFLELRR
jgi:uncharacterized membrane protein YqaE (UPF0057 family)